MVYPSFSKSIFCSYLASNIIFIFCTFHVAKGNIDTVLIPISKDQTTMQYIAKLHQGTPPMPMSLILDLGGPFLWIDCTRWYKSSSYGAAQCGLAPCASFGPDQTCSNNNTCSVVVSNPVTDRSSKEQRLIGEVASDILTVHTTDGSGPGSVVEAHTDFVCANTRLLRGLARGANGVVGFGRARSSLLTQFDNEFSDEVFFFPLKFTICLTSSSQNSGFAIFGNTNFSSMLKFTPMVQNLKGRNRVSDYYVNLTAIKINNKQLVLNTSLLSIGTKFSTVHPYSVLGTTIFKAVSDLFTKHLKGVKRVKPVKPFGTCYVSKGIETVPVIDLVFHKKSVYWRIYKANSMVKVNQNVSCLGFVDGGPNPTTGVVIGGHQLEDTVVQFGARGVGFSSSLLAMNTSCAKLLLTF